MGELRDQACPVLKAGAEAPSTYRGPEAERAEVVKNRGKQNNRLPMESPRMQFDIVVDRDEDGSLKC